MAAPETVALIERYYAAFNDGDSEGMLACLSEDVAHDVNQGKRRSGKAAFRDFTRHMERCYAEQLENMTIMASADGTRAAAEFLVLGTYIETDEGLPPASRPDLHAAGRHVLRGAGRPDRARDDLLQSRRLAGADRRAQAVTNA